ncbi:DUF2637 domain-containing protein [Streptomyces sp. NPDC057257]|uniref:DUF2637 domain-containing protein n=1 Tax=Streptomyces sp. NPDC057257 TaxID=3346071 RepID=UPI003638ED43
MPQQVPHAGRPSPTDCSPCTGMPRSEDELEGRAAKFGTTVAGIRHTGTTGNRDRNEAPPAGRGAEGWRSDLGFLTGKLVVEGSFCPTARGEGGAVRRPVVGRGADSDVWTRRMGALVVAGVAAYASYVHQREFALQGGADRTSATLRPLSVDGLLLLATVGVLKPSRGRDRRTRVVMWLAFLLGIAVSLAANIAAAPALAWKPVLVAGWPPVALLLAVELLAHRSGEDVGADGVDGSKQEVADAGDPLLERARQVDARHRRLFQRPVSAESLRKELRIGAERSRQLVAVVRAGHNHSG